MNNNQRQTRADIELARASYRHCGYIYGRTGRGGTGVLDRGNRASRDRSSSRPTIRSFSSYSIRTALLGRNRQGINVVLLRLEDWQRFHEGSKQPEDLESIMGQNAVDLINAVRSTMARSSTPLIVTFCPNSPAALADPAIRKVYAGIEEQITAALDQIPNLYLIRQDDFRSYPVDDAYDLQRDQLGHIPYTPVFYTALGNDPG